MTRISEEAIDLLQDLHSLEERLRPLTSKELTWIGERFAQIDTTTAQAFAEFFFKQGQFKSDRPCEDPFELALELYQLHQQSRVSC